MPLVIVVHFLGVILFFETISKQVVRKPRHYDLISGRNMSIAGNYSKAANFGFRYISNG